MLIFPSKTWAKKYALYMAKYGNKRITSRINKEIPKLNIKKTHPETKATMSGQ